jgi:triacylglycerol lipase
MRRLLLAVLVTAANALAGCACDAGAGVRDAGRTRDASDEDARARDAGSDAPVLSDAPPDAGRDAARLGPPYPLVLAHGFFGFDDFAGVDFIDYYWGVRAELAARGETRVYAPAVDPFNDSETRGRQLLAHVERVLAETGHARVNIIAHSQGGLDARVVASLRPDLVASVTTIATPHEGTRMADVLLRIVSDPRLQDLIDAIVRLVAAPLYDAAGAETSVFAALRLFSRDGIAAFNAAYPDAPTVRYFSIAGRTDRALATSLCRVSDRPDFLRRYDTATDPVDPLLAIPEAIIDHDVLSPTPNDGLVPVASARRGRFLGCIPADHIDEVGHLFGDSPGLLTDFDHLVFYRELVAFLRSEGL